MPVDAIGGVRSATFGWPVRSHPEGYQRAIEIALLASKNGVDRQAGIAIPVPMLPYGVRGHFVERHGPGHLTFWLVINKA